MECNDPASCGCNPPLPRRDFLKIGGIAAVSAATASVTSAQTAESNASAIPNDSTIGLIPIDKNLSPEWIAALTARGQSTVYTGDQLRKIGMPIGGICAGQLYLGGDGKLWRWDIFNKRTPTGDAHYSHPPDPDYPVDQGFALRVTAGEKTTVATLDKKGFSDIRFTGEYPIGKINYSDDKLPVTVELIAYSPFIPLNSFDSSLPATVLEYTVKNTSTQSVEVELAGWLGNPIGMNTEAEAPPITRANHRANFAGGASLVCDAKPAPMPEAREPIVFEDFEKPTYGDWKAEGTAFGDGPAKGTIGDQQVVSGFRGKGLVNTYHNTDGEIGKLTSPEFTIERSWINFLIGGGSHRGQTCMNLIVDGKVVRTATGHDTEQLRWHNWNVREFAGKTAHLEIVDASTVGWGHVLVDQIEFADRPITTLAAELLPDFGTMALALLGESKDVRVAPAVPIGKDAGGVFAGLKSADNDPKEQPVEPGGRGAIGRTVSIAAGASATFTFIVAWNFPNMPHPADPNMIVGNYYAKHFSDATAVVRYIAEHYERLGKQTQLWHDTWYDSTLPHWALDRTFLNTSILATSTCQRWRNGRFWCWEGVGCCIGTCTHVWHYAQAAARLFPDLERSTRETQDLDTGFNPKNGSIGMRGEFQELSATDGQTGTILRIYREHQMSADDDFLNRNWPRIRKAIEFVMGQDPKDEGILSGDQPNTLDTSYFGPNSDISSLWVAAARAGAEMATEVGDTAFAEQLTRIAEAGTNHIVQMLWNGEYFIQLPDPKYPNALKTGRGSFIDQVFGQSWAWQVNLPRVLPEDKTISALKALYKYNFATDCGKYREVYKPGRWYAMPGEAGLIICTWPQGGYKESRGKVNPGFAAYLNECMNGFEYQAAAHMVFEGLVTEGLAITRSLEDRYHAEKRNPWNEVECGDHYARSMASYGVFLGLCGFSCHGPKQQIGFAPRLGADDFKAPFTAATGWGTYRQQMEEKGLRVTLDVKYGTLPLKKLSVALPWGRRADITHGGQDFPCRVTATATTTEVFFDTEMVVKPRDPVEILVR